MLVGMNIFAVSELAKDIVSPSDEVLVEGVATNEAPVTTATGSSSTFLGLNKSTWALIGGVVLVLLLFAGLCYATG